MKEKNFLACFKLLKYINMKSYKNIAHIDFANVNIALNSHAYKENQNFILEFIKKYIFFVAFLNTLKQDTYL